MRYRVRGDSPVGYGPPILHEEYEYLWPSWRYYKDVRDKAAFMPWAQVSNESCLDETHKRHFGHYSSGGPLDVRRFRLRAYPAFINASMNNGYNAFKVNGHTFPCFYGMPYGHFPLGSDSLPASGMSATRSYGAQAWNQYKPGKPKVGASVFIAELRDLPGMLKKRAYAHRNLGQHYLNYQFGWLPFVSDLRKMYTTYKNVDNIITNIYRNNGKWVKRSGTVRSERSTVTEWSESWRVPVFNPLVSADIDDQTQLSCKGIISQSERVWFSGRFRYYIPAISSKILDSRWRANTVRKIMGLTITPADAWEAIPWSWLIDYFTNVGNVLSNIDSGYVDDVVASYAYVMRSSITSASQQSSGVLLDGTAYSGTITQESETKARAAADPFGFEVSGDLSPRQLAILAALGISRNR